MPTYEYACKDCGEHLEVVQSFREDSLTECPRCEGRLRKVFSAAGIIFKGSGWHVKDYASSSKPTGNGSSNDAAGSGSSDSADSGSSPASSDKGSDTPAAGGDSGSKPAKTDTGTAPSSSGATSGSSAKSA